jgi:prepilin-type N-terminal cleavage/methylation domain-containing protein
MTYKHQAYNKTAQGFTLIEVLVAAVILFSSIAMVSMVFRGAFISSEKANNHMVISGVLPAVLATLRQDIRQQGNLTLTQLTNNGAMWDVDYQWQAALLSYESAPEKFDPQSGKLVTLAPKYKLWEVQLTLKYKSLLKHYQFNELSWSSE